MDPPPSDPGANGSRPAATAAAAPPLDPPALRPVSHGFRATGPASGSVVAGNPSSGAVVLPSDTAPAASRTSATSPLTSGT
jgi:hypothetical protein